MTRLASWADYGTHDESAYPELWRGCVGAWAPCLGPTGLRLHDLSRFRNWGTLTNMDAATDWVVSRGRYALDFDGTDDVVTFTTIPSITSIATYSLHFRRGATSQHCPSLGVGVIGSTANRFAIQIWSDGVIYISFGGSNWGSFASNDLNWHHISAVFDGSQSTNATRLRVWLDGSAVALSFTGTIPSTIGAYTTMRIGQTFSGAASGNDPFGIGLFDDALIHSRALSPAEIRLLANRRGIAYERRKRKQVYFDAALFNPAWARNSNVILSPVGAA